MIPNTDITIYNKYTVTGGETYQRTVVPDVVWQATKAVSGAQSGLLSSNVAAILIPFARDANYLAPKAWAALVSKTGKWTLKEGDYIVKGSVSDEITGAFTMTSLKAKYDDVVMITSVDVMDQGSPNMQHFDVGCK